MGGIVSGVTKAVGSILGGGDEPAQAPAPDYAAAARATSAGNLEAAKYATVANRANQYNPYGSLTWQRGATDYDPWTQTVRFTPQGQQLFDLQQASDLAYGRAAQKGFENVRGLFENPSIDESKLTAMPMNQGVNSQAAIMSRLRPTLDQEQAALDAKLANQGIALGSDAYKRAINLQGQRMNDLELQAARQGIELDMNARQQGLNEQFQRMQQPLNLVNALKTGSQVQAPQFQSYAQQATTQGPDLFGAANAQYGANLDAANAQNAQTNAMMGGLFSLGGAIGGNQARTGQKIFGMF